jgi:hypothetical protein
MTGRSEKLDELAMALAIAQAEFPKVKLDGRGQIGPRSYKYATLGNVIASVRDVLTKHGLAVAQTSEDTTGGQCSLTTTLLHSSGQYMSGTTILPVAQPTPQAYGSAHTYARRYAWSAILGLATEDDLDGHEASQPAQRRESQREVRAPAGNLEHLVSQATNVDWALFWASARDLGLTRDSLHALLGITSVRDDMADQPLSQVLEWAEVRKLRGPQPQHERS